MKVFIILNTKKMFGGYSTDRQTHTQTDRHVKLIQHSFCGVKNNFFDDLY